MKALGDAEAISKSEASRRWKIRPSMVTKYLTRGMPVRPDGRLDWPTVDDWRKQHIVSPLSGSFTHRRRPEKNDAAGAETGSVLPNGSGASSYDAVRTERERIRAQRERLELERVQGTLVDAEATALYKLAASSSYTRDFHDITQGNNSVQVHHMLVPGYNAGPGWDPVTGLGSPDAENLVPALVAATGTR